jgi:hypothetical protein
LPLGRHGLTISLTRFEDFDTRHTITLTYRWSLAAAPWSFAGETEPAVTPVTPGPGTDGLP